MKVKNPKVTILEVVVTIVIALALVGGVVFNPLYPPTESICGVKPIPDDIPYFVYFQTRSGECWSVNLNEIDADQPLANRVVTAVRYDAHAQPVELVRRSWMETRALFHQDWVWVEGSLTYTQP